MKSAVRIALFGFFLTISLTSSGFSQLPVWNRVFNGLGISVGINPYNPNTAYCQGNDLGLYVTRDGGTTWAIVNGSIPVETREIIVHPKDTSTIFIVNFSDGLYRSTNAGANFTLVLAITASTAKVSSTIRCIRIQCTPGILVMRMSTDLRTAV